MTQERNRGFSATSEGLRQVKASMAEKGWTIEKLVEQAGVSTAAVKQFLQFIKVKNQRFKRSQQPWKYSQKTLWSRLNGEGEYQKPSIFQMN